MADSRNPTSRPSPNVLGPFSAMFSAEARAAIIAEELADESQHAASIQHTTIAAATSTAAATSEAGASLAAQSAA